VIETARSPREADSIPTDTIPKNAIPTEIHVDRHVITLYIHIQQGDNFMCNVVRFCA